MRVLLHDAVAVPGDPDVVLVVDDRGRRMCDDRLGRNQVALRTTGDDEDVILRVEAVSGHFACHPGLGRPRSAGAKTIRRSSWIGLDVAGEWLRPGRIH